MEENNNQPERRKKGISLTTVIMIIIIVALIAAGVSYYIFKIRNEKQEPKQNESIVENTTNTTVGDTKFSLTKETYPKIDGATAMRPMSVKIAEAVLGMTNDEAESYIVHNTTAQAYENLINKNADLIFVSEPSDAILQNAKEAGVEFEMVGIGRDGFVFVVNKENKIESLTLEQIQKIYTGEITNWSEVGGENEEIIAYQREENSGSQNLMEKMVMKGLKMKEVPMSLQRGDMSGLIDAIATYSNSKVSIGYSIYLYAKEQYVKDSIKFVSINGVYPTDESIADGSYPLSKIVYAIYRKDEPENSNTRKLVEWLKTPAGQKSVEAGGYVGLK